MIYGKGWDNEETKAALEQEKGGAAFSESLRNRVDAISHEDLVTISDICSNKDPDDNGLKTINKIFGFLEEIVLSIAWIKGFLLDAINLRIVFPDEEIAGV